MNPLLKQLMGPASRLTLAGHPGAPTPANQAPPTQASTPPAALELIPAIVRPNG